MTYDTRSMSTVFKKFFSSLAESLLIKLPNPPDKYNLESVMNYYSNFIIADDFCSNKTSENKVLKIIKKIDAAGIDKLSGRYLRDAAKILCRPLCEICSLSISREAFPDACKIAKLKAIYKKGKKTLSTTDLFLYFQLFLW